MRYPGRKSIQPASHRSKASAACRGGVGSKSSDWAGVAFSPHTNAKVQVFLLSSLSVFCCEERSNGPSRLSIVLLVAGRLLEVVSSAALEDMTSRNGRCAALPGQDGPSSPTGLVRGRVTQAAGAARRRRMGLAALLAWQYLPACLSGSHPPLGRRWKVGCARGVDSLILPGRTRVARNNMHNKPSADWPASTRPSVKVHNMYSHASSQDPGTLKMRGIGRTVRSYRALSCPRALVPLLDGHM